MKRFAQRIYQSAIAWNFLSTFLRVGAGVIILPMILRTMPPEQLGLWYVFGTLGAFATLLDFGFEPTVTWLNSLIGLTLNGRRGRHRNRRRGSAQCRLRSAGWRFER